MFAHIRTAIFTLLTILVVLVLLYFAGKNILPSIVGESATVESKKIPENIREFVGIRMPTFNLPNLEGSRVKSAEYSGVPLVIFFWSTWNKESANGIKILDDYILNYPTQVKLIKTVAINSQEDPSVVSSFMKRGGYNIRVLTDSLGETTASYKVSSLPTIFFVGKDGIIQDIQIGLINTRQFVEKVEKLLRPNGVQ